MPRLCSTSCGDPVHGLGPALLLVGGERDGQLGRRQALDLRLQLGVASGGRVERPARLRGALRQLPLRPRQSLALPVAERDRLEHRLLGNLVRPRLDHQHRVLGAGDDELEARHLLLRRGRVRDQLALDQPDAYGADGPVERDTRQTEGGRGAVYRQDVRVVLQVTRDHQADDLHLVLESVGKQGPDRPVDEARRQRLLLDGRALSLEVAAGDSAAGVGALAVLHGQRKEVLRFLRALGGDARRQHHRATVPDDDGAVRLLGHFAGLDGHGQAVDLDFHSMGHAKNCPRVSAGIRRTPCGGGAEPARLGAPGAVPSEDRSVESVSAVNGGCRACR